MDTIYSKTDADSDRNLFGCFRRVTFLPNKGRFLKKHICLKIQKLLFKKSGETIENYSKNLKFHKLLIACLNDV